MQQTHAGCADTDNGKHRGRPSLPDYARLPFNRCNLPAVILGSLTFQQHPAALFIDGVPELHRRFFAQLQQMDDPEQRAASFTTHMAAHFLLDHLDEAGLEGNGRGRLDYRRLLRGWFFDPDGREAAVIKGWVESRFGLVTRFHGEPIPAPQHPAYERFLGARSHGLYNTNSLEAQLDLLYGWCQYELGRRFPGQQHLPLHRGVNRLSDHEVLEQTGKSRYILLLNNISSFTASQERADEFGDHVLRARVPLSKIFFCTDLLPNVLQGEEEYMVLGGVYEMAKA